MLKAIKSISFVAGGLVFLLLLVWQLYPRWEIAQNYAPATEANLYLKVINDPLLTLKPPPAVGLERVDIGYAQFKLPEHIGQTAEFLHSDLGIISIESAKLTLVFLPPNNDLLRTSFQPFTQALAHQQGGLLKRVFTSSVNSQGRLENFTLFDLQMMVGDYVPVTFWDSIFMSTSEIGDLVYALMLKSTSMGHLPGGIFKVLPFHTEALVGVVYFGRHSGRIHLATHDRAVQHEIIFDTPQLSEGKITLELETFLASLRYQPDKCCYSAEEVVNLIQKNNKFQYSP